MGRRNAVREDAAGERDRLRRFFMQAPSGICILDGPDLVYELVNGPYQQLFPGRDLLGKPLLEAVPEIIDQPIWTILREVYSTGQTFEGKELLIPLKRMADGPVEDRYFNFTYQARLDENDKIDGILVFVNEVTDIVRGKLKAQESEGNLRSLVMTANHALLILRGPDLIVEMSNMALDMIWNRPSEQTMGRPLLEIFPELAGQPFPTLLHHVLETGMNIMREEQPLMIDHPDGPIHKYINFSYDPLVDGTGKVGGIIVSADDVTEKVKEKLLLRQHYQDQQTVNLVLSTANDELAALNEELAASNEELAVMNEELVAAERMLQQLVDQLAESESRFRRLVQRAPVAIFIVTGRRMIIESINDRMLKMLGKTGTITGQPFADAIPEFEDQPFLRLLNDVYASGEPYIGNEMRASIKHDGDLKEGFYNFIYQPIKNAAGETDSIICSATEVSEQVVARRKVERAEESLRMAIDAAGLGSYHINVADRIFVASPKLKEFFGFAPDEEVPYEAAINQIHPDYRQEAADLVEAAFNTGVKFDMEYPVIGFHDGKIRWVRGLGTVQHDSEGKSYFTGVLHEITESKQNETRKNDFIGMVSHELKTPLTSLTAIVQLLSLELGNMEHAFIPDALKRANVQVKKMNNMINGFLNVSNLSAGKIVIAVQQFDLEQMIRETIDETLFISTSHPIEFRECGPVLVNADRNKIGSVINNLLGNAIKYSPAGTVIQVACTIADDHAIISIKDSGMGLNPLDLEKIFDRFYRVEATNTRHISGFGIGLYLSAEIVTRHNGKIWAESDRGEGSTFYFTLPASSPGKSLQMD